MRVNGTTVTLKNGQTLYAFLTSQNYDVTTIAVEYNGEIVSRDTYANVQLSDTDTLEIVRFVGGG
ncbi:sulfur carrier protein ThiS [Aquibacillus koreensis]|uniref:Sulfur carrier protein ThiS n=1 Tax=Aquibacillus koreensis TaxID=279446 RepID=A0A9X3WLC5_9BACI|nr:sulfur carrier protein ThiS [Aquibacillus koreensis]MCT2536508.1 sulfur carrier protein ThiS [Aquibacillus koreensis]MDC3419404.1 sulfur carrier protein ThiS [Aquibacillus koreensis]